MAMIEYKIIKNNDQYELYLERFSELFNVDFSDSPELEDEFDLLALLIKNYEDKNYPIDDPSPIEYIKFIMDQQDLTNKDMVKYLGSLSKVSEVLNGKRNLSLNMIKNLHNRLGIPAEILIKNINDIDENLSSTQEKEKNKTGKITLNSSNSTFSKNNEHTQENFYHSSSIGEFGFHNKVFLA